MEDETPCPPEEAPRDPEEADLVAICRALNEAGANYLIAGGWAIIYHGYTRATEDIDLLIESSMANQHRVRKALEILPDKAVLQMEDGDLEEYTVVRIADEIVIDIALKFSGLSYEDAKEEIEFGVIDGVEIPFASPRLLLRMKEKTYRDKDIPDRLFLSRLISELEKDSDPT